MSLRPPQRNDSPRRLAQVGPALRTFIPRFVRQSLPLGFAAALLVIAGPQLRADAIEAVNSRVADDYVRVKLADGSLQPETYAFGPGGYWSGESADPSIDNAKFLDIAHVIAEPLAAQAYLPSRDPKTTKLLIMVYWGATNTTESNSSSIGFQNASSAMNTLREGIARPKLDQNGNVQRPTPSDSIQRARGTVRGAPEEEALADAWVSMVTTQNQLRRQHDVETAKLLGYDSWWESSARHEGTPLDTRRSDMLAELSDSRYFVVLMAYDFQQMWKKKQAKLLWETRFSVSRRHHEFDRILPDMARYAGKFFGRNSQGLQHSDAPIGKVELGDLQQVNATLDETH